jgi:hypothetical protein
VLVVVFQIRSQRAASLWRNTAVSAGLLVATACGHPNGSGEPPSPEASGGASGAPQATVPGALAPTPVRPADAVRILKVYSQFWDVVLEVSRRPSNSWRQVLEPVSTEPLLSQLLDGLADQRREGIVDYGTVRLRPQIVRSDGRDASIVDCQDASRSGTLDVDSGVAESVGAPRRPVAAVLELGRDGRWRLSEARLLEGTC